MKAFNKVFGIGAHKTGTTSLGEALNLLGISCTPWPWDDRLELRENLEQGVYELEMLNRFDAMTDLPIPCIYRQLDAIYPDSKFILTIRNQDEWVESVEKHLIESDAYFSRNGLHYIYEEYLFYQRWDFQRDAALESFRAHNAAVREYFSQRPDDLLEFDVAAPDKWERLCGFFDVPIPAKPYPASNASKLRTR